MGKKNVVIDLSVQSFASLSTASLHFLAPPTALRSTVHPSVPSGYSAEIVDTAPGNTLIKSAQMQTEGQVWGRPTSPLP